MKIGERIKIKRKQNKLTLGEVAQQLNISEATVQRYESGVISNIPSDKIEMLAKALNTTPAYLMGWESDNNNNNEIDYEKYGLQPITTKKFPLLGEISCGEPAYAVEDRESYIKAGTDIDADFCLKAKGDSMINARINDGDIVFIRKQSMVDNGEIAAVVIDGNATLKRVEYFREKNTLILKPENPKYDSIIYSNDELEDVNILGKAIAFQSDIY